MFDVIVKRACPRTCTGILIRIYVQLSTTLSRCCPEVHRAKKTHFIIRANEIREAPVARATSFFLVLQKRSICNIVHLKGNLLPFFCAVMHFGPSCSIIQESFSLRSHPPTFPSCLSRAPFARSICDQTKQCSRRRIAEDSPAAINSPQLC